MPNSFRLKEIQIQIMPGVTLIAEVNDISEAKALIEQLTAEGFKPTPASSEKQRQLDAEGGNLNMDDPASVVETRAELPSGALSAKKILAFKSGIPQLLRTNIYDSVTDALLVLLYAVETGLKNASIAYGDFKPLYETQGLKSGSSLPMLLNNLKNNGYIDKKQYDADRTLVLSPKGAEKAIDVLKATTNKS